MNLDHRPDDAKASAPGGQVGGGGPGIHMECIEKGPLMNLKLGLAEKSVALW